MILLNWLASADASNKDNMDKTEVNRINRNSPERVTVAEVKAKKIKLASNFYKNASSPLIDMNIDTLMGCMIAVSGMHAKMFIPIGYFKVVKPLSGSVRDCHVTKLYRQTDRF